MLEYGLFFLFLSGAVYASIATGKLTTAGALTGGVLSLLIFLGAGYTGIAMIGTFFLLGTAATSWKMKVKESFLLAEKNKGRRTAGQVIANAGVAALLGALAFFFPGKAAVFQLMMAASFASAAADTLSSELGNIYGRKFYNICTLKKDSRGLNGVISLEGTLIGIAGSAVIALIYLLGFGGTALVFFILILAGTLGNLTDSLLGATLERKHLLHNDAVNFLNTLAGALAALVAVNF